MDILYRRTAEGSFMVLEGHEVKSGFEEQMLKKNDVPHILPFYTLELNGSTQFWYNISGVRSFRDIVISEGVSLVLLHSLFSAVRDAYRSMSKYLIGDEHLFINEDALFFECKKDSYTAKVCYCPIPHEDACEQLGELMRFVIGEVDHSRSDITKLCYELNAITEREHFSFYDLMDRLQQEYDIDDRIERAGIDASMYDFSNADSCTQHGVRPAAPIDRSARRHEKAEGSAGDEPVPPAIQKKPTLMEKLKAKLKSRLPGFMTGREPFLPEKRDFCDIEFDAIPETEGATVLLSEDRLGCRGKLIYESGGRGCTDIEVSKNPFSIGSKSGGNDVVLHSEAVSRYHARITKRDGAYFLQDLNSKNGTFVNGELLPYNEQHRLQRMDVVSFADVVYRVV